jgi:UDP-N-acetylmuramate--alanine ligase
VDAARSTGRRVLTYGFDEKNDYVVRLVHKEGLASLFDVTCPGDRCVRVNIKHNPGDHNMLNATASIAVADALGCDIAEAAAGLSEFKGASRRFTHVGDACGICVVDDYGHHPTEIKKTLLAGSGLDFDRVVCVFQPHRYSRTQALADEFAVAFDDADVLFVLDVFPAGEMPIPGVTGKALARRIEAEGNVAQVTFVPNRLELIGILCDTCREGDLVFTMGAGDVTTVGPDLIRALRERAGESGEE